MAPRPHLLVALSPHGYGHTTQTAPVLNALRERLPELRITVRSSVPPQLLQARIHGAFDYLPVASDFGMRMASAVDVRADASAQAYAELHQDWERKVDDEAAQLAALAPDLILANIPYLTLAGAARAGIPAYGLCSLNWADIYAHYCGHHPAATTVHAHMLAAYNSAAAILQTAPAMPMENITRRRAIGPVAHLGRNRRGEIDALLHVSARERLVVIAPGGIELRLPVDDWPRLPGVRWLVPRAWNIQHADAVALESLNMHFTDILRSCDALIGKPGYGSFAEAACNGTPVLYIKRHDWPEEPYLIDWLQRHGRCLEIERGALARGDIHESLRTLWDMPTPIAPAPTGIEEGAEYLFASITQPIPHAP
jgi:hypothetical protein